jgi:hypothetical protein
MDPPTPPPPNYAISESILAFQKAISACAFNFSFKKLYHVIYNMH